MCWHDQMRFPGHKESWSQVNTKVHDSLYFSLEYYRIQHNTVSDEVNAVFPENPRRNVMCNVFDAIEFKCMSGIGTALKTGNNIIIRS